MGILRRIFGLFVVAGIGCFAISYFTGDGSFLSIGGMISVLVGLFGLYIAYKLIWSVMGVYLNFALVGIVCITVVYFILNLGKSNDIQPISAQNIDLEYIVDTEKEQDLASNNETGLSAEQIIANAGKRQTASENPKPGPQPQPQNGTELLFDETVNNGLASQRDNIAQQVSEQSFLDKLKSLFAIDTPTEGEQREAYNNINPFDYPSVKGYARVVRGSVLYLNGYYFRLYGIEAPYPDQTCADNHGRAYACGKKAITWLQNWLNNRMVTCYVLGDVQNGWATAICMVENDKYDIAAVVTNAGWAVAYTKNTDIYVPYEKKAAKSHRGLWKGTFYKPWDWYKIQTRKVDIKIKGNKDSGFDFWGLF